MLHISNYLLHEQFSYSFIFNKKREKKEKHYSASYKYARTEGENESQFCSESPNFGLSSTRYLDEAIS